MPRVLKHPLKIALILALLTPTYSQANSKTRARIFCALGAIGFVFSIVTIAVGATDDTSDSGSKAAIILGSILTASSGILICATGKDAIHGIEKSTPSVTPDVPREPVTEPETEPVTEV